MKKVDYKKELKHLYGPSSKKFVIVEVPPMNYLMVDGKGDPNTSESYQQAIEALYGLSFTVKFDVKKKGLGPDYTVMPLEGLWWMEGRHDFDADDKDNWSWTSMIMQPDHVSAEHVASATYQLGKRKIHQLWTKYDLSPTMKVPQFKSCTSDLMMKKVPSSHKCTSSLMRTAISST